MSNELPDKLQTDFRDGFIKALKREAWEILCSVAFVQADCEKTQKELADLHAETIDIDKRIKDLDPELAHGEERKERQDKIKALNARKQDIQQRIYGTLRPDGTHPNGRPKIVGLPGLSDMVMQYMQIIKEKNLEAQNKVRLAAFAGDWAMPEEIASS